MYAIFIFLIYQYTFTQLWKLNFTWTIFIDISNFLQYKHLVVKIYFNKHYVYLSRYIVQLPKDATLYLVQVVQYIFTLVHFN